MKRIAAIMLLFMVTVNVGVLGWKAYDITVDRRNADRLRQTVPDRVLAAAAAIEDSTADRSVRSIIVVFFTTSCAYCQAEIQDLKNHAAAFGRSRIVLVSPEDAETIRKYRLQQRLDDVPQFRVLRDTIPSLGARFRIRRVPTTLVYGSDGALRGQFEGVTPVANVLMAVEVGR